MEFEESLNQVAAKVRDLKEGIETEEATKNAFIMPFIGKEFDLKVSLQALFGVLYMAESQTGKPTVWENLKSKIAKPFISALLSEGARQLVASGASFLQLPG